MPLNQNHSYGRLIANALAAKVPFSGRAFFVTGSTDSNWEGFTEMFPTGPEGKTRVWSSLPGLLSSGIFTDGGDDIVFVLPNYTETVTSAGGLAVDTASAGLRIIGLGEGDERPLISFSTATTADFDIGSNGVVIENIRFDLTGVDALAGPIDVNDSGVVFRNCEFTVADSGGQAVVAIVTDANADGMLIDNCQFYGSENGGTTSAIRLVGGDNIKLKNSLFIGNYKITAGAIEATTTAPAALLIENCTIQNRTASSTRAMNFVEGTRAVIVNNRLAVMSGTSPISINQSSTSGLGGLIQVAGNYYQTGTTIGASTLL